MLLLNIGQRCPRSRRPHLVVNGVWLWGGGEPVKSPAHPRIAALFADDWRNRAARGCPARRPTAAGPSFPIDALRWCDSKRRSSATTRRPQLAGWTLEQQWIKPAAGAFHVGRQEPTRAHGQDRLRTRRGADWRAVFASGGCAAAVDATRAALRILNPGEPGCR
jgi:hypothetical protein